MKKALVTIFTPTYNRGYTLKRLYDSLCVQTDKNFEWIIVDDGSIDDTSVRVKEFISENKINIRYFAQLNGGKHRAINHGVKEAVGELFFIVDSDDCLPHDAIETIKREYDTIKGDIKFAGISGLKAYFNGAKVGGEEKWSTIDCNSLDLRYRHKVRGDMAEVMRTDVFREFPFPEIDGEKFCPEALIWNRIATKYLIHHFYNKIYLCEYLPDGLTAKIARLRYDSPKVSMLYYSELFNSKIPLKHKIKASINFWRFNPTYSSQKSYNMRGFINLFCIPIGKIIRLRERK
ncbi:MAG: glycosyltransferase family 2 protein [Bacteroides sp.]|nr:glycosyltransferase family 2 protein [Bacteroides sp.]